MKQIRLSQLDPARLLTYLLSRLVETHGIEQAARESRIDKVSAEGTPDGTADEILRTAERRWPSRYY